MTDRFNPTEVADLAACDIGASVAFVAPYVPDAGRGIPQKNESGVGHIVAVKHQQEKTMLVVKKLFTEETRTVCWPAEHRNASHVIYLGEDDAFEHLTLKEIRSLSK